MSRTVSESHAQVVCVEVCTNGLVVIGNGDLKQPFVALSPPQSALGIKVAYLVRVEDEQTRARHPDKVGSSKERHSRAPRPLIAFQAEITRLPMRRAGGQQLGPH